MKQNLSMASLTEHDVNNDYYVLMEIPNHNDDNDNKVLINGYIETILDIIRCSLL